MISTIKKIVLATVLVLVSVLTAEAQETVKKSKMSPWPRSQYMQQKALVKRTEVRCESRVVPLETIS